MQRLAISKALISPAGRLRLTRTQIHPSYTSTHCSSRFTRPQIPHHSPSLSKHNRHYNYPAPCKMSNLSLIESAKRLAAYRAVDKHFPHLTETTTPPLLIGIGSGSTVTYVIERILSLPQSLLSQCIFVPTGYQSRELIVSNGLHLGEIDSYNTLLVAFDGADEVDPSLNCIKGGGACLFQEKLVAVKAKKFVVVADFRKISQSLSTAYLPGIPIEVVPPSVSWVMKGLLELGSVDPTLRMGGAAKAGPCVTDNGNFIIDAPFPDGVLVEEASTGGVVKGAGVGARNEVVEALARKIKAMVGVVEHGIFSSRDVKPVVAYFGMEDGTVTTRSL